MNAETVLELVDLLKSAGIEVWLDGGWGVDALLGYQSRPHDDLDVVVDLNHLPRLREVLGSRGFELSEDDLPVRFVMAHPDLGDPSEALRRNQNAILDGYGWRPLTDEWDYDATRRRVLTEVFADEARQAGHL